MNLLYKLAASRQDKEIQYLIKTDPHKAMALMEQIYKKTGIRDHNLDSMFGKKHLVTKDVQGYARELYNKLNNNIYRNRIQKRNNNYLLSGTGKKSNVKRRLRYIKNVAAERSNAIWSGISPKEKKQILRHTMRERMGLHRFSYVPEETPQTLQKKYKLFPDNQLVEPAKAKKLLKRNLTKEELEYGVPGRKINNEVIIPQRGAIKRHIPYAFLSKDELNLMPMEKKEELFGINKLNYKNMHISGAVATSKPINSKKIKLVSKVPNYTLSKTKLKDRKFTPQEIAKLEEEAKALNKVTGNAEQPPRMNLEGVKFTTDNHNGLLFTHNNPKALNKVTGNAEQPPKTESKVTNSNEPIELNFDESKTEQPPKDINNKGNTNGNNANINNNGNNGGNNNGNNGNTPKPEPEVKTNPVEESFLKKHWGKIGLGAGALGALGYGAYRYKHRDDNNPYS